MKNINNKDKEMKEMIENDINSKIRIGIKEAEIEIKNRENQTEAKNKIKAQYYL